jgi:hypothetical protein
VRLGKDVAGAAQAGEERGGLTGPAPAGEALARGHRLGPLGQVLGAQRLAPDGAGQELLACVGPAGNEAEE